MFSCVVVYVSCVIFHVFFLSVCIEVRLAWFVFPWFVCHGSRVRVRVSWFMCRGSRVMVGVGVGGSLVVW